MTSFASLVSGLRERQHCRQSNSAFTALLAASASHLVACALVLGLSLSLSLSLLLLFALRSSYYVLRAQSNSAFRFAPNTPARLLLLPLHTHTLSNTQLVFAMQIDSANRRDKHLVILTYRISPGFTEHLFIATSYGITAACVRNSCWTDKQTAVLIAFLFVFFIVWFTEHLHCRDISHTLYSQVCEHCA